MIAHIKGEVNALADPPRLFIETSGGVTYEVMVHQSMITNESQLSVAAHGIWVWQVFAEDHQTLYGFYGHQDRDLAIKLREVQGMGPVSSAKLVQAAGYARVTAAIAAGDAKALSALCSGLGPKRAQSIITELRPFVVANAPGSLPANAASKYDKVSAALTALGITFQPEYLTKLIKDNPMMDDQTLISTYLAG